MEATREIGVSTWDHRSIGGKGVQNERRNSVIVEHLTRCWSKASRSLVIFRVSIYALIIQSLRAFGRAALLAVWSVVFCSRILLGRGGHIELVQGG